MSPNTANCANTLIFPQNAEQTLPDDTEKRNTRAVVHFRGAESQISLYIILCTRKGILFPLCYILYAANQVNRRLFGIWLNYRMVDIACIQNGMQTIKLRFKTPEIM